MSESTGKQIMGLLMGLLSIGTAYFTFLPGFLYASGDYTIFFVGEGFAVLFGILGIIFSALGIKAARYYRERKGLAIFGLVVSIMGLGTGLAMLLVYGSMILLVTSEAARGYIK